MISARLVCEHVEFQLMREARREQILENKLCSAMSICDIDLEFTTQLLQ
jgi:hypothetical protein